MPLTRRELVEAGLSLGVATVAAPALGAAAAPLPPTPENPLGLFYEPGAPTSTDLAFAGDPDHGVSKDPLVGDHRLIRPVTLVDSGGPRAAVVLGSVLG